MHPDSFLPGARGGHARLADRVWRRWTRHPEAFLLGPLAASVLGALLLPGGTPGARGEMLLTALAYAAWVPLWTRARRRDPDGRRWGVAAALAAVGAALVARLISQHLMFGLATVATLFNVFVAVPLWVAVPIGGLVLVSVDLKFQELLLRDPGAFPWTVVVLHTLVLTFIGTMVRTLASKNEERRRLLETLAVVERRAGQAEERQRLAREIHDTLAQGFAGILRHLEAAELSGAGHAPGAADVHLRQARDVARENLEEARRMMAALRPELLDGHRLEDAVRRVARDFEARTQVPARLVTTGEPGTLHPEVEVTLLRATQEALANAARHAGAARVTVTLSYMDDVVALDVRDDGRGVPEGVPAGFGLRAMRERAELLGGTLALETAAGEGTTVSVCLPRVAAVAP